MTLLNPTLQRAQPTKSKMHGYSTPSLPAQVYTPLTNMMLSLLVTEANKKSEQIPKPLLKKRNALLMRQRKNCDVQAKWPRRSLLGHRHGRVLLGLREGL